MRFDERAIKEFTNFGCEVEILLSKYDDVESEEHIFLRRLHILLDGAIQLSEKECAQFSISSSELEKFLNNAKADGLLPDEIVEDLICKYNKRG